LRVPEPRRDEVLHRMSPDPQVRFVTLLLEPAGRFGFRSSRVGPGSIRSRLSGPGGSIIAPRPIGSSANKRPPPATDRLERQCMIVTTKNSEWVIRFVSYNGFRMVLGHPGSRTGLSAGDDILFSSSAGSAIAVVREVMGWIWLNGKKWQPPGGGDYELASPGRTSQLYWTQTVYHSGFRPLRLTHCRLRALGRLFASFIAATKPRAW
jgi:hypothetical protein